MNDTPITEAKAQRILAELGPNNNGRFAAMADFARELERENARISAALNDEGYAHELWALSQRLPNEAALNAIDRVHAFLSALANK